MLGIMSHDTKKHRRNQIFEDGFDFTLAATRKEMAKQQGGFDKTKVKIAARVIEGRTETRNGGRGGVEAADELGVSLAILHQLWGSFCARFPPRVYRVTKMESTRSCLGDLDFSGSWE